MQQLDSPSDMPPKRRFRRMRFSLRGLLVFVALCGAVFAWLVVAVDRAKRQQAVIEAIVALQGGHVSFDYEYDDSGAFIRDATFKAPTWAQGTPVEEWFRSVHTVNLLGWITVPSTTAERLRAREYETDSRLESPEEVNASLAVLDDLPDLRRLRIEKMAVTDEGLVHLRRLHKLELVSLQHTLIQGPGLEHLTRAPDLTTLMLMNTYLEDEGLEHIGKMTQLEWLYLGDTKITDSGLVHLAEMKNLIELLLTNTAVTDAGLVHLRNLKSLERLYLRGTQVTDEGVEKLRQALPDCLIYHPSSTSASE